MTIISFLQLLFLLLIGVKMKKPHVNVRFLVNWLGFSKLILTNFNLIKSSKINLFEIF